MFKLPNELQQLEVTNSKLISWVIELDDSQFQVVEYFYKAKNFSDTRYFWQTPDQSFSLVGIGEVCSFVSQNYQEMYQHQLHLANNTLSNSHHFGTGAILLGGFPFDEMVDSSATWAQLGNGYMFLPDILVTEDKGKHWLTFNILAESRDSLLAQWKQLNDTWKNISQTVVKNINQSQLIHATEKHVPEWLETVEMAIEEIQSDSDIKKIVLARELAVESDEVLSVDRLVEQLLLEQKNTYCFALEGQDVAFVGATPERLLFLQDNVVSTACVAGSIPRGKTTKEDELLGQTLLDDMKNQSEHYIVVEAIENEMKKLTNTLSEQGKPTLLKNRDIQHLFFPFSGVKRPNVSFFDAINQLHPTPALGGKPKDKTTQWIRKNEPISRGLYGSPIGWCSVIREEGEFAVGIRSAVISEKKATLYAGCGIVADSNPLEELEETRVKFQPMLRAIGGDKYVASK